MKIQTMDMQMMETKLLTLIFNNRVTTDILIYSDMILSELQPSSWSFSGVSDI